MSLDRKGEPRDHGGYERTDAHAGATIRAGLYILVAMFVVAAALVPMYRLLARGETQRQPERATVIEEQPVANPFPKLVVSEPLALAEFRAQEDSVLNAYAWIEKDRGIARMPVAEAIKIVGERGQLPVFPTPSAAPGSRVGPAVPAPGGGKR